MLEAKFLNNTQLNWKVFSGTNQKICTFPSKLHYASLHVIKEEHIIPFSGPTSWKAIQSKPSMLTEK